MKKLFLFVFCLFATLSVAQNLNSDYLEYIRQYTNIALAERNKYAIPASITLAQGLLESGAGKSELARHTNNHFGIKCHNNWNGATYHYDDDAKNECFRKYNSVSESYNDHSEFLKRPRYESLFQLKITDYRGWAHGLKKAGYATDPNYANKLIKLIEDYELYKLDTKENYAIAEKEDTPIETVTENTTEQVSTSKKLKKAKSSMGEINVYVQHEVKKRNGIKYISAMAGDTYSDIAVEFDLQEAALMRFNDAVEDRQLRQGERVYLRMKKNKAGKPNVSHRVRPNETLYDIAQLYGIKLQKLCDMNELPLNTTLFEGQILRLR